MQGIEPCCNLVAESIHVQLKPRARFELAMRKRKPANSFTALGHPKLFESNRMTRRRRFSQPLLEGCTDTESLSYSTY
jgi:hypothetical protein